MNYNYRSSPVLLEALNSFFLPHDFFDTFLFTPKEHDEGKAFSYMPVQSPAGNKKGPCTSEGGVCDAPLTIVEIDKGVGMLEELAAARQIKVLLQGGYTVSDAGGTRPVRPSDIGVLVRYGYEGIKIQNELMGLGIASVRVNETKVLKTAEAAYFTLLLEAILSPSMATINRALLTPITPFSTEELRQLHDEKVVGRFTHYRERWARDGIYTALSAFLSDFEVERHLLRAAGGQRTLANVLHLAELLHTVQMRKGYSEIKLLAWLQRAISDDKRNEGDEFEMRIERDDEAVNIVTIHKSKGLEYGIVIAPFLNFKSAAADAKKPERHLSYRDAEAKRYFSVEKWRLTPAQRQAVELQENQENRRLLYVALTRAIHGCYLFLQGGTSGHFLDRFLAEARRQPADLIHFAPPLLRMPELKAATAEAVEIPAVVLPKVSFRMRQPRWQRLSYTGIHAAGERQPFPKATAQEAAYDTFMFETLKRGSKTGNLLHHLLENANLAEDTLWEKAIAATLRKHLPLQAEAYTPLLRQMLTEVGSARILPAGGGPESEFCLADVSGYKRLAELEFDYPVAPFSAPVLNALSSEAHPFSVRADLKDAEGIMTGKIDFFFEQGGKYYVLDWKSNYLGDTVEAYTPEHLEAAMKRENYHLQYLIYSLAACRYLHQRIPGFDYERDFGGAIYLFVRGVRANSSTGVFVAKPPADLLQKLDGAFKSQGLRE
jgi:exodeoxyribonuclease V beta subunit